MVLELEHFDEDRQQLSELVGWKKTSLLSVGVDNAATGKTRAGPFDTQQLQVLFDTNALDYELYCFANALRRRRSSLLAEQLQTRDVVVPSTAPVAAPVPAPVSAPAPPAPVPAPAPAPAQEREKPLPAWPVVSSKRSETVPATPAR